MACLDGPHAALGRSKDRDRLIVIDETALGQFEKKCMADRRVWPWLAWVLLEWALIAATMFVALRIAGSSGSVVVRICALVTGMWLVGVFIYRLAILGHDAGHRTVSRNPRVNDALGRLFIFFPALVGLNGYRTFHNEGHHPKAHTSSLRDPEIAIKALEKHWALPLSRAKIARRFAFNLLGGAVPTAVMFMLTTTTPRVFARLTQFLTFALFRRDQIRASILPLRLKRMSNSRAVVAGDVAFAIACWGLKLLLLIVLVRSAAGLFGFERWPLVLLLWFGGFTTSFWAVFYLRNLCEHVGTSTVQLREPSPFWRFFVFPHGIWGHQLHHDLPGMPFHRLREVLFARNAQGVAVHDLFTLIGTSKAIAAGEVPATDDERDLMRRAARAGMVGAVVRT
jgi:fatty acid desaturase